MCEQYQLADDMTEQVLASRQVERYDLRLDMQFENACKMGQKGKENAGPLPEHQYHDGGGHEVAQVILTVC